MATTTLFGLLPQSQAVPFFVPVWAVALLLVWTLVWKGIALWKAARLSNKWWFIILLVVNTVGILEIIYVFFVARKYKVETETKGGTSL